jgi:hypothetical protein
VLQSCSTNVDGYCKPRVAPSRPRLASSACNPRFSRDESLQSFAWMVKNDVGYVVANPRDNVGWGDGDARHLVPSRTRFRWITLSDPAICIDGINQAGVGIRSIQRI